MKDRLAPTIKGKKYFVLFSRDSSAKIFVRFTVSGIDPIITDYFEMFFRDMLGEPCHEIKNRNGFGDQFLVFMTIVMKSNKFAIIRVNAGSSNDRSAKITTNVFHYMRRNAFIVHDPNVKTIFMFSVNRSLYFFKRITNCGM